MAAIEYVGVWESHSFWRPGFIEPQGPGSEGVRKERAMVAYHEAGHTIVHLHPLLMPPLYKVSIVPRAQALGVTTFLPDEDQHLQCRQFLLEELLVLMGGRAAEKTFNDATTNGAAGDLEVACKIARKMIHEWGMGEKLYYEPDQRDAETEINRLLETADRPAHELIQSHKESTEKLAKALLDRETLTRDEVQQLLTPAPATFPQAKSRPDPRFPGSTAAPGQLKPA